MCFDFSGNSKFWRKTPNSDVVSPLEKLVSCCSCKQGLRSIDLCAHRVAVLYHMGLLYDNQDPFEITKNTKFESSVFCQIKDLTNRNKRQLLNQSINPNKKRKLDPKETQQNDLYLSSDSTTSSETTQSDTNTSQSDSNVTNHYLLSNLTATLCHCNVAINLLFMNECIVEFLESDVCINNSNRMIQELIKIKNRKKKIL